MLGVNLFTVYVTLRKHFTCSNSDYNDIVLKKTDFHQPKYVSCLHVSQREVKF